MCAVSMVHDYMRINVPTDAWTPGTWAQYQEIIRLLTKLDEKLDQPDCDDPAKGQWMQEVEDRLARLESA